MTEQVQQLWISGFRDVRVREAGWWRISQDLLIMLQHVSDLSSNALGAVLRSSRLSSSFCHLHSNVPTSLLGQSYSVPFPPHVMLASAAAFSCTSRISESAGSPLRLAIGVGSQDVRAVYSDMVRWHLRLISSSKRIHRLWSPLSCAVERIASAESPSFPQAFKQSCAWTHSVRTASSTSVQPFRRCGFGAREH